MKMVTRHETADRIFAYLNHRLSLAELVAWSEDVMMEGEIEQYDAVAVTEVIARLGTADVDNFGLLWEDCGELLRKLGYELDVSMRKVA